MKIRVLFVCLGNICRSPTGEAVLKKLVRDRGLEHQFHIESAGTEGFHAGEPPDRRTLRHGEARGYQFDSLAQKFANRHFEDFDHILCMDETNFYNVLRMAKSGEPMAKVKLLLDYGETGFREVPDPYYKGAEAFEQVIDLIEKACHHFLDEIMKSAKTDF